MAQILPVDKTSLAYRLLGTEVMCIHKILRYCGSRQGITVIYVTPKVTVSVYAVGPTEPLAPVAMKSKVKLKFPLGEPTTP